MNSRQVEPPATALLPCGPTHDPHDPLDISTAEALRLKEYAQRDRKRAEQCRKTDPAMSLCWAAQATDQRTPCRSAAAGYCGSVARSRWRILTAWPAEIPRRRCQQSEARRNYPGGQLGAAPANCQDGLLRASVGSCAGSEGTQQPRKDARSRSRRPVRAVNEADRGS